MKTFTRCVARGCMPRQTSPVSKLPRVFAWIALVMRSRIEPMKKVAKTLRRHRELIFN